MTTLTTTPVAPLLDRLFAEGAAASPASGSTQQRSPMQRRSFLRAISSIIPAAGLQEILARQGEAQSAAPTLSNGPHVVGAGNDRFGQPRTLGFRSSLLFKVAGSDTNGGLFIVEHAHLQPGGPPLHLHFNQEEWFYVMEGEMAFQLGELRVNLRSGESVLAPRRIPHTFSSIGTAPGRLLIAFCPAGKMEQFFQSVGANPKLNADPELFQKCEMELVGPSPFWKS